MSNQFVPKGPTYLDQNDKLRSETRNGVIQAQFMFYTAANWNPTQRVNPELLLKLQQLAVNQIYRCAGHFRDGPVFLEGADHSPPDHSEVQSLVEDMCAYIDEHWNDRSAAHLAAYAMWRVNWIHPFFGGNGRSARALSYLVLLVRVGFALPGDKTIPELIVEDRAPYFAALRAADAAWQNGVLNVSEMEQLISDLLAIQLVELHKMATGKQGDASALVSFFFKLTHYQANPKFDTPFSDHVYLLFGFSAS